MNDGAAMVLALAEAVRGLARTHPNPTVGAVLVKNGRVVSSGFHERAGAPHAEVMALKRAGGLAKGATLYSTLEPCNHHGRTPPCSEAIIRAGVKRVVFASSDPNPLVDGKGLSSLRSAGIQVTPHIMKEAADALNRPFLKVMRTGLPWITLKAAVTLDGKLATQSGDSKWITSEPARRLVHQLRDAVDAVVVGASTVVADNPLLTTRLERKSPPVRHPVRVVIDPSLRTSPKSRLYDTRVARTVVLASPSASARRINALSRQGVEVWQGEEVSGQLSLQGLLKRMASEGWLHVLVEGGATVHQSFLSESLVDEIALFVAPKLFGSEGLTWSGHLGARAVNQARQFEVLETALIGPDVLLRLQPR